MEFEENYLFEENDEQFEDEYPETEEDIIDKFLTFNSYKIILFTEKMEKNYNIKYNSFFLSEFIIDYLILNKNIKKSKYNTINKNVKYINETYIDFINLLNNLEYVTLTKYNYYEYWCLFMNFIYN